MITLKATARIEQAADGEISVTIDWSGPVGLDRPNTGGWGLGPKHAKLARRLAAAINAGKATGPATIATDVNGRTYVQADHKINGRTMNADLKRLGF